MMTIDWLYLLLFCLYSYNGSPAATNTVNWMSRRFPCDVTANNSTIFFDCKARKLLNVPGGITENVTVLDLSQNFFRNISRSSFSNLHSLKKLYLDNVIQIPKGLHIDEHAFENLTKLQVLKISGNNLCTIPTNLPQSIEVIVLYDNKITFINRSAFAGLGNVTHLYLSRNCFSSNPCGKYYTVQKNSFVNMTKLQTLKLAFNNLTGVPKGLPGSLVNFSLASNRIQSISKEDFLGLYKLKFLEIQGNCPRCVNAPYPCVPCQNISLAIHPDAFESLTQLEVLNIGGNSLMHVKTSWFEKLTKLRELFMTFNFLLDVFRGNAKFLQYIPNLKILDISYNYAFKTYPHTVNLSQDFSYLKSLETLHMEALVFQNIDTYTFEHLHGLKNLSAITLGTNFIIHSNTAAFKKLENLRIVYLAENRLYPTPNKQANYFNSGFDESLELSFSKFSTSHEENHYYRSTSVFVKKECSDAGNVLSLSSNNLFFISPAQFGGYGNIACLNLSNNGFSAALNGSEFNTLSNLTYLDLSFNKVDLAYDRAFEELKKLEVLDISHNDHYFKAFAITQNLHFLTNLPVLRVLNMSYNSISKLTTKQMYSDSLAELQFTYNYLGDLWKENDQSYEKLFANLTNLTVLDISYNKINQIPGYCYEHLPKTLFVLRIAHNSLKNFAWEKLKFPQLQILDLSYNSLTHVKNSSLNFSDTLTFLDLSNNNIFYLEDGFTKGAKSLTTLSLSHNKLPLINESTFKAGPDSQLQTLFLWENPFQCTCDSLDFILWLESSNIKIPGLTTKVTCKTPTNLKDHTLIYFEIQQCVDDSKAMLMYIFTASVTIIFMFVAIVSHLFYWDASYILHYFKARLKGYKSLNSQDCAYKLFVTYDTRDPQVSEWVLRNLRVKLEEEEGEKHLPLCLEERDWPPGVPLVDNLVQSIQSSRKTLFVLTEGYIRSGIFKLAIYLAHQRLLDENVDVIVLLMLEPVLQHSPFLRLRRRLCGESVIEWPKTPAAQPWFWQKLRNVVRTDNQAMYSKTYKRYFTNK